MKDRLLAFIAGTTYEFLPDPTQHQLVRAVVDLLGSALAGSCTPTAHIMADYAAASLPGQEATLFGRGRVCHAAGAALANACAANALDIDDGFRLAKGHPGAVVIPAALAQAEALGASGAHLLGAVAVGYEVAMRASVAWHASRPTYNGSGSWGAIGAAAACAHLLQLDATKTWSALGIAEYHAPFADVMGSVEQPSMLKDGIHWGSFVGLTAAQLAARGFTGFPHLWEKPAQRQLLTDLGQEWWIHRLYFKFYPTCRWAQPAVAGVLALRERYNLPPDQVATVRVEAFEHATHLITRQPRNTEEAQYSLCFPVACALVHGRVTPQEVTGTGLTDVKVLDMAERVEVVCDAALEAVYPAQALERVTIMLRDGQSFSIGPLPAPGDASAPPSDKELWSKFIALTTPVVGERAATELLNAIQHCAGMQDVRMLTQLLGRHNNNPSVR